MDHLDSADALSDPAFVVPRHEPTPMATPMATYAPPTSQVIEPAVEPVATTGHLPEIEIITAAQVGASNQSADVDRPAIETDGWPAFEEPAHPALEAPAPPAFPDAIRSAIISDPEGIVTGTPASPTASLTERQIVEPTVRVPTPAPVPVEQPDSSLTGLEPILHGALDVGDLTSLTFKTASVVTAAIEREHGGVVRGSWLVAAVHGHETTEPIVLLRVAESRDAQGMSHSFTGEGRADLIGSEPYRTYTTDVMGLFYRHYDRVQFSAEVDALATASTYRVFQPSNEGMSWIASFSNDGIAEGQLPLGVLRFSSSRAVDAAHGRDQATVNVNIDDFIARRTFCAGATRSGKSNSVKTITTAIVKQAALTGQTIGQIIFDPQGEYAAVNRQDGTGLRLIGDQEHVRVYRAAIGTGADADPKERRLLLNFYDPESLSAAWSLIIHALGGADSDLERAVRAVNMHEPIREQDWNHWSRGRLAFYALLQKSGYQGTFPSQYGIPFSMSHKAATAYNTAMKQAENEAMQIHQAHGTEDRWYATSPQVCLSVATWMIGQINKLATNEAKRDNADAAFATDRLIESISEIVGTGSNSWGNPSLSFQPIAQFMSLLGGAGAAAIIEMRDMHDADSTQDVTNSVWDDMVHGRLVIVDLSIGSDWVVKIMAERIVAALVQGASERFRNDMDPVPIQIVVEEAHNLFDKGRYATQDPWVRIAKEGAKYKMGMLYATQEVTSIDPRVLANTHNWVVGFLNTKTETAELSKYFGFEAFADSIRAAEDVGFARVKTYSSPFIVPTQVARFDHAMINDARVARGLNPI